LDNLLSSGIESGGESKPRSRGSNPLPLVSMDSLSMAGGVESLFNGVTGGVSPDEGRNLAGGSGCLGEAGGSGCLGEAGGSGCLGEAGGSGCLGEGTVM